MLTRASTRLDFPSSQTPAPIPDDNLPKLIVVHGGIERTLRKHPEHVAAYQRGELTLADLAAKPWQLRAKINGRERVFKLPHQEKDALRAAKDILNGRTEHASQFAEFLAVRDAKRGLTLGALAAAWTKAGLPFSKTKARDIEAAGRLKATLARTLDYWANRAVNGITQHTMEDFVVWRRTHVRKGARFTGSRSADLELGALSCLCQWAVLTGQIEKNPFAVRPTYSETQKHCHHSMPAGDDQLHQVLAHIISYGTMEAHTCAAWLAFTALTGLRPGEPAYLQRLPIARKFPDLRAALPGQLYRLPDGNWRMKVHRTKHGQNPAVLIHPALRNFLRAWSHWLRQSGSTGASPVPAGAPPAVSLLFAGATEDRVRDLLDRACLELKLPPLKPHGFGRAYYVRVRRSQGMEDPTIGVELGQTTDGKLIRDTYGDPLDPVGGNLHDWLITPRKPAWNLLYDVSPAASPAKTSQTPTEPA